MAQNRPKIGLSGQKSTAKTQLTGNCDQIPRRGAVDGILVRPLTAGHQIWPQRGLQAPFAAKFGMDFGVGAECTESGPMR